MASLSPLLDALGFIGETIDKPGAAMRGLLAGDPSQLANLIPFSDTLGITDPSKRVSGRGLLEKYGIVDPGVEGSGLDAGDVAGFAAGVLTDPLTYLPGIGLAAKAAMGAKTSAAAKGIAKPVAAKLASEVAPLAKVAAPVEKAAAQSVAEVAPEIASSVQKMPKTVQEVNAALDQVAQKHGFGSWAEYEKADPKLEFYAKTPAFRKQVDKLEILGSRIENGLPLMEPSLPPVKARNMVTQEDKYFKTWDEARNFKDSVESGKMGDWRIIYTPENFTSWDQMRKLDLNGLVGEMEAGLQNAGPKPEIGPAVQANVNPVPDVRTGSAYRSVMNRMPKFLNNGGVASIGMPLGAGINPLLSALIQGGDRQQS